MEISSIKRSNRKDITDDIWYEIFLHLPLHSIYKFRCVSKVWFSILSNPNFINKWYNLNNPLLPWGFLHNVYEPEVLDPSLIIQFSNPDLHSQFISDYQNGFSFKFLCEAVDKDIYLLGSSNGLVLCTIRIFYQTRYYVCNPLTQQWVMLPPPPEFCRAVSGFMCTECSPESVSFKVIRVPKFEDAVKEFKVEIFSSDLGGWSTYDVPCPEGVTWKFFIADNYVTHNGVLYWFQKPNDNILAISVNENDKDGTCSVGCRLINLPGRLMYDEKTYARRCLGESEGLICYTVIKYAERSLTLSVWVLDGDWYALHKDTKLNDWLAELKSRFIDDGSDEEDLIREIVVEGFSPVDKNVVIIGFEDYVWAYNIETRVYEQLCHPSFQPSNLPSPQLTTLGFVLKPRPTVLPPVSCSDT